MEEKKYAGFWVRTMAELLDIIILGIPIAIFVSIFFGSGWMFNENLGAEFLNFLLGTIITIFFWVNLNGRTPGKILMGIKIITFPDGQSLTYGRSLLRCLVGYTLSALILGLGFIMIAFRNDKRGLHDLIAGTCVIYEE